jgi:hypothetical protein|nr:MAG TPA: protein of unknown function (DUF872) [Caudoviricetes sp.]
MKMNWQIVVGSIIFVLMFVVCLFLGIYSIFTGHIAGGLIITITYLGGLLIIWGSYKNIKSKK